MAKFWASFSNKSGDSYATKTMEATGGCGALLARDDGRGPQPTSGYKDF
jgi:hypothetical protein